MGILGLLFFLCLFTGVAQSKQNLSYVDHKAFSIPKAALNSTENIAACIQITFSTEKRKDKGCIRLGYA